MIRTLALAAGLAIGASATQAAFLGVNMVQGDNAAASAAIGAPATTFQIFAVFDGLGDGATNTVVSTSFVNLTLQNAAGTYFNSTFGGDTPPNAALINLPGFESLRFDTYGTIGATDNSGGGANISTEPGSSITDTAIVGGWFNSNPPSFIGAATDQGTFFGTILFNISVLGDVGDLTGGDTSASVIINNMLFGAVSVFEQGQGMAIQHDVTFSDVPTPGALALFGIAGLAASKRRRR